MTGARAVDARWNARDFFADDADARVVRNLARHRLRESHAIDGERRAGGDARQIGRAHDQRAQPAHLLFQEADGVIEFVAAEGIAADELGEAVGLVHRGRAYGPHLVDDDRHLESCGLPRGLASCEATADDGDHGNAEC